MKAAGTDDGDKVMAQMRKTKLSDFFTKSGTLRADGLMIHDMYLFEVKAPADSKYPWDYYKPVATVPGDQAFLPEAKSVCPLLKKS